MRVREDRLVSVTADAILQISSEPAESCGFVTGRDGILSRCFRIRNKSEDVRRFSMSRSAVAMFSFGYLLSGDDCLAVYHCHERSFEPSRDDVENMAPSLTYAIACDGKVAFYGVDGLGVFTMPCVIRGCR